MNPYGSLSDDFYMNFHLSTEMDLPQNRETLLHFFEQIQRRYPRLNNFYNRDRNEHVLEEGKESGGYRWVSVESKRVGSGMVNPPTLEDAIQQHRDVLELAPYTLSLSRLDCESLSVVFGFDYTYRGNHNQLLIDTLGVPAAIEGLCGYGGQAVLAYEPNLQFALDEELRTQARLNFESRTTGYHLRSGEFGEEQLSVYLTVRRYDSLGVDEDYTQELERLVELGRQLLDDHVVENILRPLQHAIAAK